MPAGQGAPVPAASPDQPNKVWHCPADRRALWHVARRMWTTCYAYRVCSVIWPELASGGETGSVWRVAKVGRSGWTEGPFRWVQDVARRGRAQTSTFQKGQVTGTLGSCSKGSQVGTSQGQSWRRSSSIRRRDQLPMLCVRSDPPSGHARPVSPSAATAVLRPPALTLWEDGWRLPSFQGSLGSPLPA